MPQETLPILIFVDRFLSLLGKGLRRVAVRSSYLFAVMSRYKMTIPHSTAISRGADTPPWGHPPISGVRDENTFVEK